MKLKSRWEYSPLMRSVSHLMEFPNRILIGDGVLRDLGEFIEASGVKRKVVVAAGTTVQQKVRDAVASSIDSTVTWVDVLAPDMENVDRVISETAGKSCVVGLGGGKSVDVGKLAAFKKNLPFFSVPTSASHDGISSPFASIRGLDRPYSFKAKPPIGILADVSVIAEAPRRLLSSGCGDLVSKMTAVNDWQLAHEETGEYYGGYAANLAMMSASVVLDGSRTIRSYSKESVRDLVEALISAGVAAGIAGSSRPCSGAEHLFSHYLDQVSPGVGLHGEKCGLGTIMMANLQGANWKRVRSALRNVKAPTKASEIGLSKGSVIRALVGASSIRPDRYTILSKHKLSANRAEALAKSTGVI
jgi:glycerol-1-phosphate dehydrogenase [NAD(P)+]